MFGCRVCCPLHTPPISTPQFEVEEAGEEAPEAGSASDGGLNDAAATEERRVSRLLDFLQRRRVVDLTEAGARFGLKPRELADRLRNLQAAGRASGVLDADRGKFVWITEEEFLAIRDEVRRRGRLSAGQLQKVCNQLVDLTPSPTDQGEDIERFDDEDESEEDEVSNDDPQ